MANKFEFPEESWQALLCLALTNRDSLTQETIFRARSISIKFELDLRFIIINDYWKFTLEV